MDFRGAVLDVLELQEQLIGMSVRPSADLAAVVAEAHSDRGAVRLEGGQDVATHQVHGGDRQLRGLELFSGVPRTAFDG